MEKQLIMHRDIVSPLPAFALILPPESAYVLITPKFSFRAFRPTEAARYSKLPVNYC